MIADRDGAHDFIRRRSSISVGRSSLAAVAECRLASARARAHACDSLHRAAFLARASNCPRNLHHQATVAASSIQTSSRTGERTRARTSALLAVAVVLVVVVVVVGRRRRRDAETRRA